MYIDHINIVDLIGKRGDRHSSPVGTHTRTGVNGLYALIPVLPDIISLAGLYRRQLFIMEVVFPAVSGGIRIFRDGKSQVIAAQESISVYFLYPRRDRNLPEAGAMAEGVLPDRGQTFRERNIGQ